MLGLPFLSLCFGLASIASSSCDSDVDGCRDVTTLLQVGASAHAVGQEEQTSAKALLLELGGNLGIAKGQGDLLRFGEQLVRMANATAHLNESEESVLQEVIELINETLIPNLDSEHEANQELLDSKSNAIGACNTVLATSNSSGGLVGGKRVSTSSARTAHVDCRTQEFVLYNAKVSATNALYEHIGGITPVFEDETVFDAAWKTNNDLVAIANYFSSDGAQKWVNWFTVAKDDFVAKRDSSAQANTTHSAKRVVCNGHQTTFEDGYRLFKNAFEDACDTHERCYTKEKGEYDTLLARLMTVEDNHHAVYEAAIIIISKIQCLVVEGTHSYCSEPQVQENRYALTVPSVPARTDCDMTEVEHAVCADGSSFETKEYHALARPAAACQSGP